MEKEKDVWSFKTSDLVTIPNIITYVRFVLIIPFVYFFLAEQYIYAAICIGLSGLSDCFDGMAARKLNQVTPLGKILDPIADKVTLFAVVICMVIYVPMVLPILVTLLVKDLLMLLGGADLIKKRLTPPSANWYGKVGTIIFYFSVCLRSQLSQASCAGYSGRCGYQTAPILQSRSVPAGGSAQRDLR